jgi:hypothetical protein
MANVTRDNVPHRLARRYNVRQVVFILSTNYSGSHLLSQLLGAHSCCRSVGELHNLRKYRVRQDPERDVQDDFSSDPIFDSLDRLPDREWHRQIFRNLELRGTQTTSLIDNSKRPAWAARFDDHEITRRHIHLIRDPRALVRRWMTSYTTRDAVRRQRIRLARAAPRFLRTALWGDDVNLYLYKWLVANQRITDFLVRIDPSARVVTYRDLVLRTRETLERVMPSVGLEFEPQQLNYGASITGTRKRRYVQQSERSQFVIDTRWQTELSTERRAAIETNRLVRNYLASLSLEMTGDGLTHECTE